MDGLAAAAAITQLIGQSIIVIKEIRRARHFVHSTEKFIEDYTSQLNVIETTLLLIQAEPALQTAAISEQILAVKSTLLELNTLLRQFEARQESSKIRQHAHALASGRRYTDQLKEVLQHLDRAREALDTRILVANVGLSRASNNNTTEVLPLLWRIDKKVEAVLGSRLEIAKRLEGVRNDTESVILDDDIATEMSFSDTAGVEAPITSYVGNITLDQAIQLFGNLGQVPWQQAARLEVKDNVARGDSVQVFGNTDQQSLQTIFSNRRQR